MKSRRFTLPSYLYNPIVPARIWRFRLNLLGLIWLVGVAFLFFVLPECEAPALKLWLGIPAGLAIATLLLAWPEVRGLRLGRIRLPPPGVCAVCGYDLRATSKPGAPLLDRCPECGADSPALRLRLADRYQD